MLLVTGALSRSATKTDAPSDERSMMSGAGSRPASGAVAAGTLAVLHLSGWKVRRRLSLVHSRDVPLTPAAQRFVEVLRTAWAPERKPAGWAS